MPQSIVDFARAARSNMPVIIRAFNYFLMLTFVEAAKEFATVGAQNLRNYSFFDWLIVFSSIGSVTFIGMNSYFDTSFAQHQQVKKEKENEETAFIHKNQSNSSSPSI